MRFVRLRVVTKLSFKENKMRCLQSTTQFTSVAQSCLTLCTSGCSTPGFPVHHQLPELAPTHVHQVGDAIQPSHPLSSPSPAAFNLAQHKGLFKWVSSSHPGKNTGMGCHAFLQGIFPTQGLNRRLFRVLQGAGKFFTTSATWGLPSIGSHRLRHDWSDLAAAAAAPPGKPTE